MSVSTKQQPNVARVVMVPLQFDIMDMNGDKVGERVVNVRAVVADLQLGQEPVPVRIADAISPLVESGGLHV